ncbi:hypothetical protein Thein_0902 [Thermodesulfatator indicus DSM 15286]|uniref:Uncharacterized protein n=1 Tax=Thermodesulfatator indicus (strain DSM 15286 / JCM 11887 / CIR29812) TaxID=667014 RepID=F8AD47_THEID|nr:hypothetical protein [Thermodesulfatator indicus]AEH44779.1 hypothetical protein Thein_0902 [Thermodesulfatator indicus DSM 15286]
MKIQDRLVSKNLIRDLKSQKGPTRASFQEILQKTLEKPIKTSKTVEITSSLETSLSRVNQLAQEVMATLEDVLKGNPADLSLLEAKAQELKEAAQTFPQGVRETLEEVALLAVVHSAKAKEGLI